jgi:hypothetical protein
VPLKPYNELPDNMWLTDVAQAALVSFSAGDL